MQRRSLVTRTVLATFAIWAALAGALPMAMAAEPAATPPARLRGTVERFDGRTLVLKERNGEVMNLVVADDFKVSEVLPTELSAIRSGAFVGIASLPQKDGTLQALEVLVFPEAMRGSGEGHYPWDLQPESTMTNATVADVVASPGGRVLTLKFKDGQKTVQVPPQVPVVTLQPGDPALLVPGARVMVTAQVRDGKPTALRALAGRNGFAPPM